MDEIEKAACYLQLLKQEGQLDDTAIPQLISMYGLSEEQAHLLLQRFKKTDAYKRSLYVNLLDKSGMLLFFLLGGLSFLYLALAKDGSSLFSVHALLYLLPALAILIYLGKLVLEHAASSERFKKIPLAALQRNKLLPFLLMSAGYLVYLAYQYSEKTFLLTPESMAVLSHVTVNSNCDRVVTTGKNSKDYFRFNLSEYNKEFRWTKEDHLLSFSGDQLSLPMYKGDTVNIYIDKTAMRELNDESSGSYIEVKDISLAGKHLLNFTLRNGRAKENAQQALRSSFYLFMFMLVIFVINQFRIKKEPELTFEDRYKQREKERDWI